MPSLDGSRGKEKKNFGKEGRKKKEGEGKEEEEERRSNEWQEQEHKGKNKSSAQEHEARTTGEQAEAISNKKDLHSMNIMPCCRANSRPSSLAISRSGCIVQATVKGC